jgi:hypothetical protein
MQATAWRFVELLPSRRSVRVRANSVDWKDRRVQCRNVVYALAMWKFRRCWRRRNDFLFFSPFEKGSRGCDRHNEPMFWVIRIFERFAVLYLHSRQCSQIFVKVLLLN